jgi:hypothetical protein
LTITTGLISLTEMRNIKNLFVAAAVFLSAIVSAIPTGAQEAMENTGTTGETAQPAPGRFDGYLFLDADGHPLPFQSDEQIEKVLSTATVVSMKKIPVGVSDPRKVLLAGQGVQLHAVFKDIDHEERNIRIKTAGKSKMFLMWRDWYGYDVAAYHVDRLLGNDRVPPIIKREIKRIDGSVQIWLEGAITENERREKGFKPPNIARFNQQREIMHIFDNLVGNRDSNLGNTLIDRNWRLWFIDCSRCFGTSEDLLFPEAITHCERRLWKVLRELDETEATRQLAPYLSKGEISALMVRRDKIVEHIQALMEEWGEGSILFDIGPPTEVAPWANE